MKIMCEWIPIKTRPATEEEKVHYKGHLCVLLDDEFEILDCPLPEDGQEVLVTYGGYVYLDVFCRDYDGCYFEDCPMEDVTAWMPLPEPFKKEVEE